MAHRGVGEQVTNTTSALSFFAALAGAEVEDLFGRREAILECDAVHLADVLTEPPIERFVRSADRLEGAGEVVGFEVDDGAVVRRMRRKALA